MFHGLFQCILYGVAKNLTLNSVLDRKEERSQMRSTNRTDVYLAQLERERRGRENAGCRSRYVYRVITHFNLQYRRGEQSTGRAG